MPATPSGPGSAFALPPGTRVGTYEIERVLHQGLHGFVYRAHDAQGHAWALKEFFPAALARRGEDGSMRARQAGDAISLSVARQAFLDEAQALSAVEHPGLVRVAGIVQAFHTLYRVMPLVAGVPLDQWVAARNEPASVREVRELIDGLLGPLSALHAAGVVHGHVRPDQVLVIPEFNPLAVLLLGFGNVARELGALEDGPWAAPEAVARTRSARITTASDLYAVATCAWLAATGAAPPSAADRAAGRAWPIRDGLERLVDDPAAPPGRRESLVHALEAALSMAPEARPQRVADLRRLLGGDQSVRLVESVPPPLWVGETPDRDAQRGDIEMIGSAEVRSAASAIEPRRPSWPRWVMAGAVVLALGASAIAWWVSRPTVPSIVGGADRVTPEHWA